MLLLRLLLLLVAVITVAASATMSHIVNCVCLIVIGVMDV